MMKKMRFALIIGLVLTPLTVLFQNCGRSESWSTEDMSSSMIEDTFEHMDEDHPGQELSSTSYNPINADRFYLMAIFKDVFGATAPTTESNKIYEKIGAFGFPCSFYEDYRIAARERPSMEQTCALTDSVEFTNAPILPTMGTARQAYTVNSCTALVRNTTTLRFAMAKINQAPYTAPPTVTRAKLERLFELFYRGKPAPSPGVIDSLEMMFVNEDLTRGWQMAIYAICISSHWQEL